MVKSSLKEAGVKLRDFIHIKQREHRATIYRGSTKLKLDVSNTFNGLFFCLSNCCRSTMNYGLSAEHIESEQGKQSHQANKELRLILAVYDSGSYNSNGDNTVQLDLSYHRNILLQFLS